MSDFGISLDTVKGFLGYSTGSPTDTSRDVILQLWLDSAVGYLKLSTGRNLEKALYRDTFSYLPPHLYLQEFPVSGIQAVNIGNSALILDTDYQAFFSSGRVEFNNCRPYTIGHAWSSSFQRLSFDYVGGYDTLPPVMVMAVMVGIQAAERAQIQTATYGGVVKQITVVDVGSTAFSVRQNYSSAAMQQAMNEHLVDYIANTPGLGTPLLHECERIGDAPGSP